MNRTKTRTEEVLGETHHIIPKSFGGTSDNMNVVKLTYREHFIITSYKLR
jgi:hypothetical protein